MRVITHILPFKTQGKGTYEITIQVYEFLVESKLKDGIITVFSQHTGCSLIITEKADPTAREDLHRYMDKLVPENNIYKHMHEGPDDMPAHIKTVLTSTSQTIPFSDSHLLLGTWQGLFLYEHRAAAHQRNVIVSLIGV